MIEKVSTLIAFISTVNSQLCQVPCNHGGISQVALQPICAKVRAVPSPSLAVPPSVLAPVPRAVLPNANAIPKQQLVCPLEYSIIGSSLPSLPLQNPTLSEPCSYSPLSIPAYPEFVLTDYTNDLYVPSLAVPPSVLAPVPRAVLPNANAIPKQQLLCPLEYSMISQSLPLQNPTLTEPCSYSPLSVPAYAEFILTDYTNDLCVPEPVFDILGCLDPILTRYGTISEVLVPEIPQNPLISPFLPVASPVSSLAPPLSPLLPPALPSECSCHFLKKIAIPPPFI